MFRFCLLCMGKKKNLQWRKNNIAISEIEANICDLYYLEIAAVIGKDMKPSVRNFIPEMIA